MIYRQVIIVIAITTEDINTNTEFPEGTSALVLETLGPDREHTGALCL